MIAVSNMVRGLAMVRTIRAVYENGILRPTEKLPLSEGETVEVIITQRNAPGPWLTEPTRPEEDYARRIRDAKSLQEMLAVMNSAPFSPGDDFDLVNEINESRRLTG